MILELPKLCIQCDHHRTTVDKNTHLCAHPLLANRVSGGPTSCAYNRATGNPCGQDGRLFTPRERPASPATIMPAPGEAA